VKCRSLSDNSADDNSKQRTLRTLRMRSRLTVLSIRDAGTDRRTSAQSRSVPPEWKAPAVKQTAEFRSDHLSIHVVRCGSALLNTVFASRFVFTAVFTQCFSKMSQPQCSIGTALKKTCSREVQKRRSWQSYSQRDRTLFKLRTKIPHLSTVCQKHDVDFRSGYSWKESIAVTPSSVT